MRARYVVVAVAVLLALSMSRLAAAPVLFEGFEEFQQDVLDANDCQPPNTNNCPNYGPEGGPGNPWWGPQPPNFYVVGPECADPVILPHSGTNMARGQHSFCDSLFTIGDEEFYNLAYRLHGSNVYSGNILLDWWFYDGVGLGTTNASNGHIGPDDYGDYVALANYFGMPTNADYVSYDQPGIPIQTLSLGGTTDANLSSGYDNTKYQAQIQGATNGYDPDWFNTSTPRSIGWHHARITVSPLISGKTNNVAFYIDDMVRPTLTNSILNTNGFNCIQLTANNAGVTAYYDDISLYDHLPVQRPNLSIAEVGTNVVVTFPDLWVLQSSTNLATTNWVYVTSGISPSTNNTYIYTNSAGASQQYFRLRNF